MSKFHNPLCNLWRWLWCWCLTAALGRVLGSRFFEHLVTCMPRTWSLAGCAPHQPSDVVEAKWSDDGECDSLIVNPHERRQQAKLEDDSQYLLWPGAGLHGAFWEELRHSENNRSHAPSRGFLRLTQQNCPIGRNGSKYGIRGMLGLARCASKGVCALHFFRQQEFHFELSDWGDGHKESVRIYFCTIDFCINGLIF